LNKKVVVIKLGGSVITKKDKPFSIRKEVIESLVKELKTFKNKLSLVIVHGGGSFGHPIAKKYKINEGIKDTGQLIGVAEVRYWMTKLNTIILEEMLKEKLPVFPFHPSSFVMTSSHGIFLLFSDPIKAALERGLIPLTFGDVVLDKNKGVSILSGDDLACKLSIELKAKMLVYGVDVDGVYIFNTSGEDVPAKTLSLSEINKVHFVKNKRMDVTGGMRHKLEVASEAVKGGIKVIIGNLTVPSNLSNILSGDEGKYTVLLP